MAGFRKIFKAIQLREMRLKNRLVGSPVTTNFANPFGEPTERLIHFYRERAKGGASLIIVEGSFVHPEGKGYVNQLGIHEDKLIPLLGRLTEAIHEGGAKASIQIHHVGRRTSSKISGSIPKAPSPIPCYPGGEVPEELTLDGIKKVVEAHVLAALRAKKAGFDSVDIHAAHGYLIPAFFSPLSNKRNDAYGGSIENRVRIAVEIIKGIKGVVGRDFPVTMKVSGDEYATGGLSVKEMKQIVLVLENAGIDAISVSAGTVTLEEGKLDPENPHQFVRTLPMGTREGCFSYLASAIKETVAIPVMAVGRINTPFVAEEILNKKQADLICLGRGLLADPYFPQKAAEGKPEEIRVCIACNQGCFDRLLMQQSITCMINPRIGHEGEYAIERTTKPRMVWVVGGGPAGMEAARVASLKGNKVTLFNDQRELGGQLRLACVPPDREEFNRILHYQKDRLDKQKVIFKPNTLLGKEEILQEKPDTIIFATGAKPAAVQIEGISGKNVISAWDILSGTEVAGDNVIVIGGGLVGCETAEFLAKKAKRVVLVEMLGEIAVDATGDNRKYIIGKLNRLPVNIRKNTTAEKITEGGILCSIDGKEEFIYGEAVVLALGAKPNRSLLRSLDIRNGYLKVGGKSIRILEAGDCLGVRTAVEAFSEGFEAGLKA